MKKILSSILCLAMCCTILCACGDSKDKDSNETTSAETTTEETTTETTEETIEDTTTETTTEAVTEEVTTETTEVTTETTTEEIVEEGFNKKQAVAKIEKLVEAHDVLVDQNKEVENAFLNATENANTKYAPKNINTSDNICLYEAKGTFAICINYFYDYVNNNDEYYDFENYITTHTFHEIADRYLFDGYDKFTTCEIVMLEAIGLTPYIKQSENIEYGYLVEESTIKIQKVEVAYSMTIKCDDNGGDFIAVYDIDGNILNVIPANDDFNDYITTF